MLFKGLDRLKRSSLMMTIVLMFVGIMLLILPEGYIPFLSHALGFALLVLFMLSIFFFLSSRKALIHYIYLSIGLLAGLFGVALLSFDGLLVSVMGWLVGTIPILLGAYGLFHALLYARRSGRRGWWVLILLSAALMCFGGMVFLNPWMYSTHAVMQVIGGTLLFSAFATALSLIWIWPIHKS